MGSPAYADAGRWRRLVRQAVTTGPVAGLSARWLPDLDRHVARATGGRTTFSALVTGLPVVELTTTGARSGVLRTSRVLAVPAADGLVVVAANFGSDRHPAWFHNAVANPEVRICLPRSEPRAYRARVLHGAEREEGFSLALALNPGWRRFATRADREIPVLLLTATPVSTSP